MKTLLLLILLVITINTSANECRLIVPYAPGGSTDLYANALRTSNRKFHIDYKPGAFTSLAIAHIEHNKDQFFIANPVMYSAANPNKNPNVELLHILFGIDLAIITGKNITFEDLLTKQLNIGVPGIGQPQHLVALQLKEKNPLIEIVPMGSDIKALPLVINKGIDAYISGAVIANKWLVDFNTITNIVTVPFNKSITINNVTLSNLNFIGVFVSKDLTTLQRAHITSCINTSTTAAEYRTILSSVGIVPLNIIGIEKDKLLEAHIKWLQKYDNR